MWPRTIVSERPALPAWRAESGLLGRLVGWGIHCPVTEPWTTEAWIDRVLTARAKAPSPAAPEPFAP